MRSLNWTTAHKKRLRRESRAESRIANVSERKHWTRFELEFAEKQIWRVS